MISVDTNILVYAHRAESVFFTQAYDCIKSLAEFHDVRIAAICIENSVSVLYSADRDFGRFKDLKKSNPLV